MARGRKPLPTSLKLLKGTQPCRVNAGEPEFPVGAPEPPAYLKGEALGHWHELAPLLASGGVLTAADRHALAALCECFRLWREEPENLRRLAAYNRLVVEFGLTPSSRSKVRAAPTAPKDDLADFTKKQA